MFFLIGHRGVGKTTVVQALGGIDLDAEISKNHDIDSVFDKGEEEKFREIEKNTLRNVLENEQVNLVALGAGFELDKFSFPEDATLIWLQRKSDHKGRVFLNRPRLDKDSSPLSEFKNRFAARESAYSKASDFNIELEEGSVSSGVDLLKILLAKEKFFSGSAYYTVTDLKDLEFVSGNLELRNDLLTEDEIVHILNKKNDSKILFAIRKKLSGAFLKRLGEFENLIVDVPFEFKKDYAAQFKGDHFFYSSHEIDDFEQVAKESVHRHVKWAPVVGSFGELMSLHEKIKNLDVSFLPRSESTGLAKWSWYRQIRMSKNRINFYRFGLSDYLDQPAHFELQEPIHNLKPEHGGLVGTDTYLSRSPAFHRSFFKEKFKSTYLNIPMSSDEFTEENLNFLAKMGVRYLSVTAPFKRAAADFVQEPFPLNTLVCGANLSGADTDSLSMEHLIKKMAHQKSILIWGSGAIGELLFKAFSGKAKLYSVREMQGKIINDNFEALIWCAGPEAEAPNLKSAPRIVQDIEYKEHSRARSVALDWGSEYISGEEFFNVQADGQQKFWLQNKSESKE